MERIEADILIPGRGDAMQNGCVVIDGPSIAYAGPAEGAPKAPSGVRTHRVPAIMPGMWECHGHFMGLKTFNVEEAARTPVPVLAARALADAQRGLAAGFTSVRELGGLGIYLARAIDEGSVPGPHVYASGGMLSPTGGHGDVHAFPLDYIVDLLAQTGLGVLCDGVPECLKAVRTRLRLNARVIKICASGGVASEVDHPVHQQFSLEEIRDLLGMKPENPRSCNRVMNMLDGKIEESTERIREMQRFRRQLTRYRKQCREALAEGESCPVILEISHPHESERVRNCS